MKRRTLIIITAATMLATACNHDSYQDGDGKYSHLTAEFAEVHTNNQAMVEYAVSDDGDTIQFQTKQKFRNINRPDTVYRALVYYQKQTTKAELTTISTIPVIEPTENIAALSDPILFESTWLSKTRKYLNIGFALKTGQVKGQENRQSIGIVCDSVTTKPNGEKTIHLRIAHNQNGVPQYYHVHSYISIPLKQIAKGTIIKLNINDYSGAIKKEIQL